MSIFSGGIVFNTAKHQEMKQLSKVNSSKKPFK